MARKQKICSLRGKFGTVVDGHPGHQDHTLKQVTEPTATGDHPLQQQCSLQRALLLQAAQVLERRQVFDVLRRAFIGAPIMPAV